MILDLFNAYDEAEIEFGHKPSYLVMSKTNYHNYTTSAVRGDWLRSVFPVSYETFHGVPIVVVETESVLEFVGKAMDAVSYKVEIE